MPFIGTKAKVGIGLAICRSIVDAHQSQMCRTRRGGSTSFLITSRNDEAG